MVRTPRRRAETAMHHTHPVAAFAASVLFLLGATHPGVARASEGPGSGALLLEAFERNGTRIRPITVDHRHDGSSALAL